MKWLHFCDFHIGGPRTPQKNALDSLIRTVERVCDQTAGNVDAVFLVGDLVYSGKKEEYARFKDDFYLPLMAVPKVANATVFAVPGNHDVDCNIGVPVTWDTIQPRRQEIFFAEDEDGQRLRKHRAEVFEAYSSFIKEQNILSPDPKSEVSKVYDLEDLPATIVVTNTAFFSDESENKRPKSTPVPLASLRYVTRKLSCKNPVLILGHHSPDSFRADHLKHLKNLLSDKNASFFHGHEHTPSAIFSGDGSLRTLGFGATYIQSLEVQPEESYANSFTFCQLEDRLLLTSFSWEHGVWKDTTSTQYPDCELVTRTPFEMVTIKMPFKHNLAQEESTSSTPIARVNRAHPTLSAIVPISHPNEKLWRQIFLMSDHLQHLLLDEKSKLLVLPEEDGKWQGILESHNTRNLLVCIPGPSHVLSVKEVETINTRLDTEAFESATILSLGILSEEARNMYLRLQARKHIEILVNSDLSRNADQLLSNEQKRHIRSLDASNTTVRLLVTEQQMYCLVVQEEAAQQTFYLLDKNGSTVAPGSNLINALRKGNTYLAKAAYTGEVFQGTLKISHPFDESKYLKQSFNEYNSTKYAALASIGIRFSDLPLKELYVNATACEIVEDHNSRVEAIVEDHLAKFPASDSLKNHIRREMLASIKVETHQETSDAREFCQKYQAVLVTGDPGSGKTCFVKNEILAYSERAIQSSGSQISSWHSVHVPILVQLSEMVREQDYESRSLFDIISRLLERKGLVFPSSEIETAAAQGRLSIFFDGLDEVVSIEKRAAVVRILNNFVSENLSFGNRVIVTSRPAAVHLVNLLPTFRRLELQGLGQNDIRLLAQRVLSLRVVDTSEGALVDIKKTVETDATLVEKLLEDCRLNPGVARLAQNPLLLTLLVLIYANSGSLSAKRHLIYEEAIKTLASVRGREAGHAPISIQDLRERLGAVALAVYNKESGLLPTRSEVRSQIQEVMSKQRNEDVTSAEADQFIQRVAESTGLITIGGREDTNANAVVTFMHHSFLEYFAAIGLSLELQKVNLEDLVHKPRWHEILTLLSGIIGENADIAPILSRFLSSGRGNDVDAKLLSFSMDCALESEIPSETAQRLLAKHLAECIRRGPARVDPWVRAELGRRLAALFDSCGATEFEGMLSYFMYKGTDDECAASIQIAAYASENGTISHVLSEGVKKASERTSEVVIGAICWAAGHIDIFRSSEALQVISTNLAKTGKKKQHAFDALSKIPNLAAKHWPSIINGIQHDDEIIQKSASIAAVQAGINADLIAMTADKKDILLRAFRLFDTSVQEAKTAKIRKETIERMLDSGDRTNRLIGIGLIPMIDQPEAYVFGILWSLLNSNVREEVVAALEALRYSGNTLSLVSGSDMKSVISLLDSQTVDVRIATFHLLGLFGRDHTAVNSLLQLDPSDMRLEEYWAYMNALGSVKLSKRTASEIAEYQILDLLDPSTKMSFHNIQKLSACLDAIKRLEENASDRLVGKLIECVDDYKTDMLIRKRAILALPAVSIPSEKSVTQLTEWLTHLIGDYELELVQIPATLARKCRQSVDYIIACVRSLTAFEAACVNLHAKIAKRPISSDNEFKVSELRGGIQDISTILVAFHEYIQK